MAKQKFHVGKTIARVNNPKNEHLFKTLGIDVTVSQTNFILHLIEQSIPGNAFVHLQDLSHSDLAIVDAKIDARSPVVNKTLGEISLPEGCVITAVCRGTQLIVPNPSTRILAGDNVIAISHHDHEDALRKMLVG
jgi:trk system potassium uptake protein